jgi:uncharacterized protein
MWKVDYEIVVDREWATQTAYIRGLSDSGDNKLELAGDGAGSWRVNGGRARHLDGCLDVDLEASVLTNAFPVHRLALQVGETADAPAAYVRAADLRVERLEQRYTRLDNDRDHPRYHYAAPDFEFECCLIYDRDGLVLEYPGIATRVA